MNMTRAEMAEREEEELRAYLGPEFAREALESYQDTLAREFAACGDEEVFYRTSTAYLYNLTAFAMTGTKLPYVRTLERLVPRGSRILDYGCGIGSDGLLLLEAGYRVEFADFSNPSTDYLRWRLNRRGLEAPIHDLDEFVPSGFAAAYSFDVIEHVQEPFEFLRKMEGLADIVLVNLLEPEANDQEIHHPLPIREIREHAVARGVTSYRIHYGRSHLISYRSRRADALARLVGRSRVYAGSLRATAGSAAR